jgi:hypothetical protein
MWRNVWKLTHPTPARSAAASSTRRTLQSPKRVPLRVTNTGPSARGGRTAQSLRASAGESGRSRRELRVLSRDTRPR